jgi:HEAT repeat protein
MKMGFLDRLSKPNVDKLEARGEVESLIKVLDHKDWYVREDAALALGRLGDTRAVEMLIVLLEVRRRRGFGSDAARLLGKLGDARAVEPLIAALKDKDFPFVQEDAAEALGQLGDARAVEPLLAALNGKDKDVVKAAALALDRIGVPVVEPLIAALKDKEKGVVWAAAAALTGIGAPAVEPLIAALRELNAPARKAAVEALGQIGDARAVEPLVASLGDCDATVRKAVAWTLEKLAWQPEGDGEAASYWAARQYWNKCIVIGVAAVEPLIAALVGCDTDVRKDEDEGWGQSDAVARRDAAEALGKIGDARAVEPLGAALEDNFPAVGEAAANALREIGTPRALYLIAASRETSAVSRDLSEPEMLRVLRDLCDAYATNDRAAIARLEPQATAIGKALDKRGGYAEMLRVFEKLGDRRGSRTLEMHWGGIGDWQG